MITFGKHNGKVYLNSPLTTLWGIDFYYSILQIKNEQT